MFPNYFAVSSLPAQRVTVTIWTCQEIRFRVVFVLTYDLAISLNPCRVSIAVKTGRGDAICFAGILVDPICLKPMSRV